jgi:hypothetical protein
LSKQDGQVIAFIRTDQSGALSAPIVKDGILYVYTRRGALFAFTI